MSGNDGGQTSSLKVPSIDLDVLASLVLASFDEFSLSDFGERVATLRKAVRFDLVGCDGRILRTDEELATGLGELLREGVHEGWIDVLMMRYSNFHRREVPWRLGRLLRENPRLTSTVAEILVQLALACFQDSLD